MMQRPCLSPHQRALVTVHVGFASAAFLRGGFPARGTDSAVTRDNFRPAADVSCVVPGRVPTICSALAAATLTTAFAPAPAAVDDRQGSAIHNFLDRYAAGDFRGPAAALGAAGRVETWVRMFQRDAPGWIAAGRPGEQPRRRLAVAALVLEMTEARLQEDWADLRDLVEWACVLVRTDPPAQDELAWQHAALAVIGGAWDARFLTTPPPLKEGQKPPTPLMFGHAEHVRLRHPGDGRVALAEAFIAEAAAPRETTLRPEPLPLPSRFAELAASRARQRTLRAIEVLAPLVDHAEAGDEARLRSGYLSYKAGDGDGALASFAAVSNSDDVFVRYLAHYFSGRVHERREARAVAERAYRQAIDVLPGAQSAAIALSTLLFLDSRPDEAYAVMQAAMAVSPAPMDPWRVYGYGDYRRWPEARDAMRRAVAGGAR
jgi:hypothetical protein